MLKEKNKYYYGLGRRKSAVAKVRIYRRSKGFTVNNIDANKYFNNTNLVNLIKKPLTILELEDKVKVDINIRGGGKSGQAEAARLAISRSLNSMDNNLRSTLKKAKLLTRDSREKERKKPGLKRARKAPQFSKR